MINDSKNTNPEHYNNYYENYLIDSIRPTVCYEIQPTEINYIRTGEPISFSLFDPFTHCNFLIPKNILYSEDNTEYDQIDANEILAGFDREISENTRREGVDYVRTLKVRFKNVWSCYDYFEVWVEKWQKLVHDSIYQNFDPRAKIEEIKRWGRILTEEERGGQAHNLPFLGWERELTDEEKEGDEIKYYLRLIESLNKTSNQYKTLVNTGRTALYLIQNSRAIITEYLTEYYPAQAVMSLSDNQSEMTLIESTGPIKKLTWNGNKKVLINVFRQLRTTYTKAGKPLINEGYDEIAPFIIQYFNGFENNKLSTIATQLQKTLDDPQGLNVPLDLTAPD